MTIESKLFMLTISCIACIFLGLFIFKRATEFKHTFPAVALGLFLTVVYPVSVSAMILDGII